MSIRIDLVPSNNQVHIFFSSSRHFIYQTDQTSKNKITQRKIKKYQDMYTTNVGAGLSLYHFNTILWMFCCYCHTRLRICDSNVGSHGIIIWLDHRTSRHKVRDLGNCGKYERNSDYLRCDPPQSQLVFVCILLNKLWKTN